MITEKPVTFQTPPWALSATYTHLQFKHFTAPIETRTWTIPVLWRLRAFEEQFEIHKREGGTDSTIELQENGRFLRRVFRRWWIRHQWEFVEPWRHSQRPNSSRHCRIPGWQRMCFWHWVGFEEKVQLVFATLFSITVAVEEQNEDCSFVKFYGLMTAFVTLIGNRKQCGWLIFSQYLRNPAWLLTLRHSYHRKTQKWVMRNITLTRIIYTWSWNDEIRWEFATSIYRWSNRQFTQLRAKIMQAWSQHPILQTMDEANTLSLLREADAKLWFRG